MFTVGNEVRAFNTVSLPLQRFSSASRFECVSSCLNINQNCTWTHSGNKWKKPTDCRACVHVAWLTLWKPSLGGRSEPPAACLPPSCSKKTMLLTEVVKGSMYHRLRIPHLDTPQLDTNIPAAETLLCHMRATLTQTCINTKGAWWTTLGTVER